MILFFALLVATFIISIISFLVSHYVEKLNISETTSILIGSLGYIFLAVSILICLAIATMIALVMILQYGF